MRPALVIKPNPVTDDSIGMLQGLKPMNDLALSIHKKLGEVPFSILTLLLFAQM
jgi:hypothetical protein